MDTERRSLQFKTDGQSCSVVSMSLIVTSGEKKNTLDDPHWEVDVVDQQ